MIIKNLEVETGAVPMLVATMDNRRKIKSPLMPGFMFDPPLTSDATEALAVLFARSVNGLTRTIKRSR